MAKEEKEQLAIRREALKGYDNFLLSIGFFFTFVVLANAKLSEEMKASV